MAEAGSTDSIPDPQAPRPFDAERQLRQQASQGTDDHEEAQQLAFQALEAHGHAEARVLAAQALELDPECIDALNIIVATEAVGPEEAAHRMRDVAARAEAALGEAFITEHKGRLWEHMEARPYLRSRMALADLLERAGKLKEALPHLEALLRFSPDQPQELRYHLARCYACLGKTKALQRLLRSFEKDPGPVWAYMQVLLQLRLRDEKNALKALERARALNPHIESCLKGTSKLPKESPALALPGSPEEAADAVRFLAPAWASDHEAMYWLFKAAKR